jgi:hypothetical protein
MFLAKLAVSLALLSYLAWMVDWSKVARVLADADLSVAMFAPLALVLGLFAAAWRWTKALASFGIRLSFSMALRAYWLGIYYAAFLPGVLGGDAIRVAICVRNAACPLAVATATVVLERIMGVLALIALAASVYLSFRSYFSHFLSPSEVGLIRMGAALLAAVAVGSWLAYKYSLSLATRTTESPGWAVLRRALDWIGRMDVALLSKLFVLSIVFQVADIAAAFVLARSIGIELPLIAFLVVFPIVFIATVLPISLGGLGVREGALVYLLGKLHVPLADALSLSLLIYFNRLLVGGTAGLWEMVQTLRTRLIN